MNTVPGDVEPKQPSVGIDLPQIIESNREEHTSPDCSEIVGNAMKGGHRLGFDAT